MKLSVIIVNYNVKHYLYQCLESVYRAIKGLDAEVFVVDNHSRDGSISYVSSRFERVNYVESNHNLGFARANNIAIRQSQGEFVLLLNPDTFVSEDSIRETLAFMEEHEDSDEGFGENYYTLNGWTKVDALYVDGDSENNLIRKKGKMFKTTDYLHHLFSEEGRHPLPVELHKGTEERYASLL